MSTGSFNERKLFIQPTSGIDYHFGSLRGLRLALNQRVIVHRIDNQRIAGENFVLQGEDVGVRRDVTQSLDKQRPISGADRSYAKLSQINPSISD